MKFERHLDCEAVDLLPLSDGYEKLVFLLADRTLAFHAAYGMHYSVRIPRFGRSLAYHRETCEVSDITVSTHMLMDIENNTVYTMYRALRKKIVIVH